MFTFLQLSIFLGLISLSLSSFAEIYEVRKNFVGARMLGMGGASIAVVNDETALMVNPAGLGKLRDFFGTLIDPDADISYQLNQIYTNQAFTDPFSITDVKDSLNVTRDAPYHARAQINPSVVVKNFGFGVFARKVLDAKMNPTGASMPTFYQDDMSAHLGVNLRLFDGRIKIGAVAKAISRIEVNKDLDPTGNLNMDQIANEGVGVGSDAGIILTAPWAGLPTISAVVRDIGGTPFTAGSGVRMNSQTHIAPATTSQDIDVSIAFFPIHGNRSRSTIAFQYDKITEASTSGDVTRYYHFGYEYNYADTFFLRAGMNQRYATGGVEFSTEHTQFQIATYGEDIGPVGTPTEDRRYVFKFAFRF